jgi:hypothetical protein
MFKTNTSLHNVDTRTQRVSNVYYKNVYHVHRPTGPNVLRVRGCAKFGAWEHF